MKCACCKSELSISGSKEVYDDFLDNFINSDVYLCTNLYCDVHKYYGCWNSDGVFYSGKFIDIDTIFIDKNCGAFGSVERKIIVSVYKPNLRKERIFPISVFGIIPYIAYGYEGDLDGNILKVKRSLKFYKKIFEKDSKNIEYSLTPFHICFNTWNYLFSNFKENIKNKNYEIAFNKYGCQSWEYRWFEKFTKLFYKKYYKLSLEQNKK